MCIFCSIVNKKIRSNIQYEDDLVLAFDDINPVADIHILIIPKIHIVNLYEKSSDGKELIYGRMLKVASDLSRKHKLKNGFRIVINNGKDGLQDVNHLHIHLIGGRKLSYPIA
jgi:histidine triad (HIT) family protein